jgi:hypothetical protein
MPTVLPAIGSKHKSYPISGLLKLGGIIFPKEAKVKKNSWEPEGGHPNEPYVLLGVNCLIGENISPAKGRRMLRDCRGRPSAFNLDDAAAIFYNDIDLGKPPYSVFILGSLWDKCPIVVMVNEKGEKIITKVPWEKEVPGKALVPCSVGGTDIY